MTQYEELKQEIKELHSDIELIKNAMGGTFVYNYIDKNMPEWVRPTVQKLADKGYIKGDGSGFGLSDELLRMLVINDRADIYDRKVNEELYDGGWNQPPYFFARTSKNQDFYHKIKKTF